MKRRVLIWLACFWLSLGLAVAQVTKVTGVVTSADDGEPVVGASVLVEGTTTGTITDLDGNFEIAQLPEGAKNLIVSYIGMVTQRVAVKPGRLVVVLKSDSQALDEVVVTAMGMKRSEKTLGYASTTVKSDNLDLGKSGSVMGGLSGKVAGVQITSAGATGASQKVLIRGISSLNGNSPLYIVDGVPITNERVSADPSDTSTTDFGNGANDINADDVESVTVLKGASATALYGSRAANGVVMITTKKAGVEKLTLTYDGSFTASNVLRVMQTQNLFGQGWGSWDRAENGSWGPRLDGTIHEWGSDQLENVMTKPFSYVKHNLRNFYQTGFEQNHNISLRYGNEKVGVVASYGNLNSNGILPNDGDKYTRNTFSLRGYMNIDKFTLDMTMNYVRKDISRSNSMYQELLQHAVDVNYSEMKDYNDERYNLDNYYTYYATNPYYMVDNFRGDYQDDRVYGRIELGYQLLKGLKATGRLGGDFSNYRTSQQEPKTVFSVGSYSEVGGATEENGYYSQYSYNRGQIDATLMLNADYNVGDFSINGAAGWNLNQRTYSYVGAYVNGLAIPGWYSLLNTSDAAVSDPYKSKRRLIGAFAQAEVGYKERLFLSLSGRNDWSSTLPSDQNSFFYGGVNLSAILTEWIPALKESKYVNFLKVRAAVGKTGSDADVYRTSSWYNIANYKDLNSYYTSLPMNSVMGMTSSNTVPSNTLKPEMTTEYEFGVNGNFFENRVTLDFAYYDRTTKDQIIRATLAPESGYTRETRNVGELQNRGVEIALSLTPVRTKDWEWKIGATFTKNISKVKELWDDLDEYTYTSWRGIYYVLRKGHSIGEFRIPKANRVTDESSPYYGYTIVTNNGFQSDSSTEYDYVGSSEPDFTMGFNTQLKWKNFTFGATVDWRKGGYMVSNTAYISHFNGNSTATVYNERNSFIYPHSVKVVNGQYVENNIPVLSNQMNYALGNYSYSPQARSEFILPKDYVRLRELALNYDFPKEWLAKTPFRQVLVGVVGRNLLLFTPKENNYVDPDATNLGNDLLSEFGETTGTSSTRNIGVNLKVVF
jgi:TonB-linked SusC/RagA family outer membrane protein